MAKAGQNKDPLAELERRWATRTMQVVDDWANGLEESGYENYITKLAAVTGIDKEKLKNGLAAKRFKEFAESADDYVEKYKSGLETAISTHRWSRRFVRGLTRKGSV